MEPSEYWLYIVRSEECWIDESRLKLGDRSIAEGKVGDVSGQDWNTDSNEEQSKPECQLSLTDDDSRLTHIEHELPHPIRIHRYYSCTYRMT